MTGRTVVVDSALLSVRARFPIRSAVSTAVQISFEPELFFGHIFVLTECGRVRLCADTLRAICRGAIIFGGTLLPNGTFCTVSAATVEASLSAVFDAVLAASTFVPDAQPGLAVRVCTTRLRVIAWRTVKRSTIHTSFVPVEFAITAGHAVLPTNGITMAKGGHAVGIFATGFPAGTSFSNTPAAIASTIDAGFALS